MMLSLSLKSSSLSGCPISVNDKNIYLAMLFRYLEDTFNHRLQEIPYQSCHFCFLYISGTSFHICYHRCPSHHLLPGLLHWPPKWTPCLHFCSLPFHFPQSNENDLFKMWFCSHDLSLPKSFIYFPLFVR